MIALSLGVGYMHHIGGGHHDIVPPGKIVDLLTVVRSGSLSPSPKRTCVRPQVTRLCNARYFSPVVFRLFALFFTRPTLFPSDYTGF